MDDVYGGTYRLFERVRRRSAGLDFSYVDLNDPARSGCAAPGDAHDLGRDADQPDAEDSLTWPSASRRSRKSAG
jgi:hypothetical protein